MTNGTCAKSITLLLQMWLHAHLFQRYLDRNTFSCSSKSVMLLKVVNGKYGSVPCSAPHEITFHCHSVVST
jgi:hypothetical protein